MTTCVKCLKKFIPKRIGTKFCSKECQVIYNRELIIKKKNENRDTIICQWCKRNVVSIYGTHILRTHPDKTILEYKSEFPGLPICTEEHIKKTTINSGKHMQTEKYKTMFSEKFKGENNPNHTSKTTEQDRKERSPFSKEFYKKKGIEESEIDSNLREFVSDALKYRLTETQLKYWINKCDTIDEAKQKYIERQTTFSREICEQKYGIEMGFKIWVDRQEKWLKSYKKNNYSKVSQTLFVILYENEKLNSIKEKIFFATLDKQNNCYDFSGKNHEYRLKLNNSYILPDFYVLENNKIIEFDGVYWHKNTPENFTREAVRDKNIDESGYKVLHINELDYKNNTVKVIEQCINFILDI